MKAVKGEELMVTCDNKVGKLEELTALLKSKNINLRGINAFVYNSKAAFRLITSDNVKAKEALKAMGSLETKEVIIVDMPDEVGQLNLIPLHGCEMRPSHKAKRPSVGVRTYHHNQDADEQEQLGGLLPRLHRQDGNSVCMV